MSEKNLSSISDSEWEVMRIVWTLGETNTKQILNELQAKKDWTDRYQGFLVLFKKHIAPVTYTQQFPTKY